ncbi:class I alpha-mannosidase 1a [Phlyctema vagabunda]|uniref:alpha-1,2-Mannosidase n=1 Tax=Phlyctema vagabunda TaxID=108571 RepID=A0ABR4PSL4_9HELO
MLRLPIRLRRYRIFLACAVMMVIALVRFSSTSDWEYADVASFDFGHTAPKQDAKPPVVEAPVPKPEVAETPKAPVYTGKPSIAVVPSTHPTKAVTQTKSADSNAIPPLPIITPTPTVDNAIPKVVIPDRKPPIQGGLYDDEAEEQIMYPAAPPGRQEFPTFAAEATTIHWERQKEHFPVPTSELINLPSGTPHPMPKIQYAFNDETTDARINREKRQSSVKKEFQKAWAGYRKNAWLHDELSPVSGKFRDPFCGWAATLVDTLDTLWIMGLKEEFEEAAKAVDLIDFTTSPRADIPLFETTIRYLGGLLAAFDVSEGQYQNLLDKAVELAEILIGAFDTPNRIPVLYYMWRPAFASQPHRASTRSNLAELGSLSMEFTRLAQLTKQPKYYDAVARITNALSEWQDRGTKIDGLFPENVDASGCNRSVHISLPISEGPGQNAHGPPPEIPLGYLPAVDGADGVAVGPKIKQAPTPPGPGDLALQITPGEPGKAQIKNWDSTGFSKKTKRDFGDLELTNSTAESNHTLPVRQTPVSHNAAQAHMEEQCDPQGLVSGDGIFGWDRFSMGGGQDSTYEYFTKQHLLLGGLEDKYGKLYKKTADAIRKWMLYRPMLPDNRDVLFTGQITSNGSPETDIKLTAEVTHLTCFIGGMIGMGAKIFDIEGDLEIAKKLTDGCVWAYEATTSGIMPESATTLACESAASCPWNQTAYYLALDPLGETRDQILADYIVTKAQLDVELEAAKGTAGAIAPVVPSAAPEQLDTPSAASIPNTFESQGNVVKRQLSPDVAGDSNTDNAITDNSSADDTSVGNLHAEDTSPDDTSSDDTSAGDTGSDDTGSDDANSDDTSSDVTSTGGSATEYESIENDIVDATSADENNTARSVQEQPEARDNSEKKEYKQRLKSTKAELENSPAGYAGEVPLTEASKTAQEIIPDPNRPMSHKEYVASRIRTQELPPGYVSVGSAKYILRPEAIESVWYMYRITGDKTWQDKGWKMFESIIKATSSEFGHSAIYDVLVKETQQVDEMESFWLAETLKYFYLLYSTPDTISLDDWVLNTEAHPFRRPS